MVLYTVSRYPAESYGERIRQKRLELGLTQRDLAKSLGADKMSVLNWENDKHLPAARFQRRIKKILGVEE